MFQNDLILTLVFNAGCNEMNTNEELQRFFEKGVKGCLTQYTKSLGHDGRCLYRGFNGLKCFVGHNITDTAYHEDIEGKALNADKVKNSIIKSGFSIIFIIKYNDKILKLQEIHDYEAVDDWYIKFKNFGVENGLDVTFMDVFKGCNDEK